MQADYSVYRKVVSDLLSGSEQLPSLPGTTFEIRRALSQPDLSLIQLSKLVAKDPSLSAVLLKYASSPLIGNPSPPQNILDVIRLLGLNQVERITMVHSVRSLFAVHSVKHRKLFMEAWRRMALKASLSAYIAKEVSRISPDHVLMAALLSEVGALGILSAFKNTEESPDLATYVSLCRKYAKSLSAITLKKWEVDDEYLNVVRTVGEWGAVSDGPINLCDIINLGLYHSLKLTQNDANLPSISTLTAYKKLLPPASDTVVGGLKVVMMNIQEIRTLAKSLF